jgi:hypothetical protein
VVPRSIELDQEDRVLRPWQAYLLSTELDHTDDATGQQDASVGRGGQRGHLEIISVT